MENLQSSQADTTIQLRTSRFDRDLIDQAAQVAGMNRTQFMLKAAVRDAKNVLLNQTALFVDARTFTSILDQLDHPSPPSDALKKTLTEPSPWDRD
ncbi:MAG: DUF1778 domain-containing protein [Thiolinea sp.]